MCPKILKGAVVLPLKKELAEDKEIKRSALPEKVYIPLRQHAGAPCRPLVKKGDVVKRGDKIGDAGEKITAPVHSSVDGTVEDVNQHPVATGESVETVIINVDKGTNLSNFETPGFPGEKEIADKTRGEIVNAVHECGVVGMGGAAFPTAVKLNPPPDKSLDVLVINGCECEPYLTCDHRLMVERPKELLMGVQLLMKATGVEKCHICIEKNKKDAIHSLKAENSNPQIKIESLPSMYPLGAEKQLIKSVLDREVPSGGLPFDVGVLVQNVATTVAIYEAVVFGKPLVERIVTVTGENIAQPQNLITPIGTPLWWLIEQCGGVKEEPAKVIVGGPMMGFAQSNLNVPIMKGNNGVVVLKNKKVSTQKIYPCVRCGSCVNACPMGLYPNYLSTYIEDSSFGLAEKWNIIDCIQCGVCSYVCPAKRPIVQLIKEGKEEITKRK